MEDDGTYFTPIVNVRVDGTPIGPWYSMSLSLPTSLTFQDCFAEALDRVVHEEVRSPQWLSDVIPARLHHVLSSAPLSSVTTSHRND